MTATRVRTVHCHPPYTCADSWPTRYSPALPGRSVGGDERQPAQRRVRAETEPQSDNHAMVQKRKQNDVSSTVSTTRVAATHSTSNVEGVRAQAAGSDQLQAGRRPL